MSARIPRSHATATASPRPDAADQPPAGETEAGCGFFVRGNQRAMLVSERRPELETDHFTMQCGVGQR